MIQKGTYLNVIDNSGVKQISCIHIVGGYRKRYAKIGDLIVASVKSVRFKEDMKIKKGDVVRAVIVRTKVMSSMQRHVISSVRYFENSAVLLSKQNKLIGTRVFGGIHNHFRYTRFSKILALSSGNIK